MADNPTHASVLICPKGKEFGTITTEQYELITSGSSYIYKKVNSKIYSNWEFNIKTLTEKTKTTTTYKKPLPGSLNPDIIPPPVTDTTTVSGILSELNGFDEFGLPKFKEVSGYPPRNSFDTTNGSFIYMGSSLGGPISLGGGNKIRITADGTIYDYALLTNFTAFIYQDNFYIAISKGYAVGDELEITTITDTVIETKYKSTSNEYADTEIITTYTITSRLFEN
jgi:hypothetical protein